MAVDRESMFDFPCGHDWRRFYEDPSLPPIDDRPAWKRELSARLDRVIAALEDADSSEVSAEERTEIDQIKKRLSRLESIILKKQMAVGEGKGVGSPKGVQL